MSEKKKENAKKMIEFVREAWNVTPSLILMTDDYVYALWPVDEQRETWKEASFTFSDGELEARELPAKRALMLLIEEIAIALPSFQNITIASDKEKLEEIIKKLEESG
ncbi:MAG: hypothetical protein ACTSXJ_07150 [Candidatus Baldrarchaeia archaeon]